MRTLLEHSEAGVTLGDEAIIKRDPATDSHRGSPDGPDPSTLVGQRIGSYEVERVVASGGMGTVLAAIQPGPNRRVALKLLRPELLGPALIQRFSLEVQVLGKLHHPNIAQVYDGGSETLLGIHVPFFAMEFVPNAVSIQEYAAGVRRRDSDLEPNSGAGAGSRTRRAESSRASVAGAEGVSADMADPAGGPTGEEDVHESETVALIADPEVASQRAERLEIESTLRLFSQVCDAITHAHLRGVIHRDLKPDNVLVDSQAETPHPKVIDFGIARFSEEGSGATGLTSAGQILGTLETMSPEQARGDSEAIDVRTDVYALGVILHQMLTGKAPLDVRGRSVPEAIRIILEDSPRPASEERSGVRPELDAIVLKSLSKGMDRRYESVRAFQDDIHAFLEGRTVTAKAPSTLDVMKMTARRHRAILIPAAIIFVVAIAAAIVSSRFAIQARDRAEEAAQRSNEVGRLAYRSSLSAASGAIEDADVSAAERFLLDAPEGLRGWEWHHLWSRIRGEIATFDADRGLSSSRTFAVSGDFYATVSTADSTIHLWDARSGDKVRALSIEGEPTWVWFDGEEELVALCFGARGDSFYRFSIEGRELEHWDVPAFLAQNVTSRPTSVTTTLTRDWYAGYSDAPQEGWVAWGRYDPASLVLYDLRSKEVIAQRSWPGAILWSQNFGPVLSRRAVAIRDSLGRSNIEVLDVPSLSTIRVLDDLPLDPGVLAMSPDARFVATGAEDRNLYVWDLEIPGSEPAYTIEMPERPNHPVLSDDGELLAIARMDRKVTVVELASGNVRGTVDIPLWESESNDSRGLVSKQIALWGTKAFRPGSHVLYLAPTDGPVQVWDFGQADPRRLATHASYVYPVEIASRGGFVLSGAWDGYVGESGSLRWTDLKSGEPIGQLGPLGTFVMAARLTRSESEAWISLVPDKRMDLDAYLPDDALGMAVANGARRDQFGTLVRLSMTSGDVLAAYSLPNEITSLDVGPNDTRVVCADLLGVARVLEATTGDVLHETEAGRPSGPMKPQTRRLLSTSNDRTVKVWSVPDGREIAQLTGHGADVLCARFSPDGARIAAGGRRGELRLWHGETYEPLTSMRLHDSYIFDLEWTEDGQTLVTGSGDGTVRVWETKLLRERIAARESRAALVETVGPAIDAAFRAGADPDETWARMVGDSEVPTRESQVVWQEILRRSLKY